MGVQPWWTADATHMIEKIKFSENILAEYEMKLINSLS